MILTLALVLSAGCKTEEGGCDPGTSPDCDAATVTTITSDTPDPSVIGQVVHVDFDVAGSSGTPPGNVEVTVDDAGLESCSVPASAGGCDIK
ncbi:MAG: hypothetical protein AMS21_13465, partial [Gemmatimonas sp. SG8_38_2]